MDLILYDDTTRALRRIESFLPKVDLHAMPFERRPYMGLAQFFAAAGQAARARVWLATDSAEAPDSSYRLVSGPARSATLGYIAAAEGRYEEAVRQLWRADTTFDGPEGNCVICNLDDIGLVWSRAGAVDSAISYLERYLAPPQTGRLGLDAFWRPLILKRLGEMYEARGDIPNAVRVYREFIKLWERADPKLQPKVADAKFRVSRLADIEGKSQ
jgi:tetratricopeptide (TPR) repeat protein